MKIGRKTIGTKSTYVIAEAGINHNGDFEIAKQMITEASSTGVDAIKFQTFFPEELFSPLLNPDLFDWVKKLSFTKKQHIELKKYASSQNLEFLSTASGKKSLNLLLDIKISALKIASTDINNLDFIKLMIKTKLPLIVSTGMSSLSEIIQVHNLIKEFNSPHCILHCNSSYPTPIKEANLSNIPYFASIFDVPIGYSDHTIGVDVPLSATTLGASVIEKHFTLDKNMDGPDQKLSADTKDFRKLVSQIRRIEKMFGKHRIKINSSEKVFQKNMRKSVGARTDIPKNTKIKSSMLQLFRPGIGIPPTEMKNLINLTSKMGIKKGQLISWNMF
jgi:N,N'-diacetyllegionaminate synthase